MKRPLKLVWLIFLTACTTAILPAAGLHVASEKRAAVDSELNQVDSADVSTESLNRLDRLYAQLQADYGYRPAVDPLAGFAEGAPALTPEAAVLALRNARSAVARLRSETTSLESIFTNRETGELSAAEFEKGLFEALTTIEAVAAQIRSDVYVDILGKLEARAGEASTRVVPGQPALQMRRLAEEMERGIDSYGSAYSLPVVSVRDLRRPSLHSMADAMIELSVDLRVGRGAGFQAAE